MNVCTGRGRVFLFALALFLSACGGSSPPAARNVVLIVVDTLGAAHLGAYGGEARTPNIDRLATEGVRFERAYSTAPWTKPSIASLFTGVMPSTHGVQKLPHMLGEEVLTLAEHARAQGFQTHAIVSHFLITPDHGYGQGFASFDPRGIAGHDGISSRKVTDAALEFLDGHAGSKGAKGTGEEGEEAERFFLFVHYFDPHFAYHQHPRFPHTEEYEGPVKPGMEIWGLRDMRAEMQEPDVRYLKGLYREEIAFTDHHIGRLLEGLRAHGLDDDTLVVFTADHGEEMMEHGWIGHTRTLYEELIRVPLIVRLPGAQARTELQPVTILDVAPTVAQLCGLPRHPGWEGMSLAPLVRDGSRVGENRPIFAEVAFGQDRPEGDRRNERAQQKFAKKTAVILNDFKLIHDETSDSYELYDCRSDLEERNNLWQGEASKENPLFSMLRAWESVRGSGSGAARSFDESQLEELRKLGYVR